MVFNFAFLGYFLYVFFVGQRNSCTILINKHLLRHVIFDIDGEDLSVEKDPSLRSG
jgi:hypothetical protein